MKEHAIPLLLSIVSTLLNYIFISAISSKSQQQTVQDFKTVLGYLMEELKSGQTDLSSDINKAEQHILNEVKQSAKKE